MLKLIKQLRKKDSQHGDNKKREKGLYPDPSSTPVHLPAVATLAALALDPVRYGLKELPLLATNDVGSDTTDEINVVAVHGLGGHFYKTWASNDPHEHILWLSQLLPQVLPGARIFSFGYESAPIFSRSVNGIRDSARTLLSHVLAIIEKCPDRPVVFICHSLGGIVVKQAMILAHEEDYFDSVLRATVAIMFMGTPHRGSQIAAALSPIAKLANFWLDMSFTSVFTGSMRTDLIESLTRDSAKLDEINESFKQRAKTMSIISCYERVKPPGSTQLVVEKHSAVLGLPDEIPIPIEADHMSMCRFSSSTDPGYELVSQALVRAVKKVIAKRSQNSFTESERRYMASFGPRCFVDIEEHVQGTCDWSIEIEQYLMWQREQKSAVLWLTGYAGCGKTVLTNYLVQELKNKTVSELRNVTKSGMVCFFFCARDVEAQKDARSLLRDLILQILTSEKEIIRHIKATYGSTKLEYDLSFETLWRIFEMAVGLAPCKYLYIVIDALDECEEKSKSRLLSKFFSSLPLQTQTGGKRGKIVKFIISGPPHVNTAWSASNSHLSHFYIRMEERPPKVINDVNRFIDYKVNELVFNAICSRSFGEKLKTALYNQAENSFLWLSVVLNDIRIGLSYRDSDLQRILAGLPRNLIDAYTTYLPKVPESEIPRLKRYLQLIVACLRPPTLYEVDAFMELSNQSTVFSLSNVDETLVASSLRRALGPLVKFPDRSVQVIHSTVKGYFISLHLEPEHLLHDTHGVELSSAHLLLAIACMRYLVHEEIPPDLFDGEQSDFGSYSASPTSARAAHQSDESGPLADLFDIEDVRFLQDESTFYNAACADIRNRYQAYDYAATNWAYHYARSEHIAEDSVMEDAIMLLSCGSARLSNWYRYKAHQSPIRMPTSPESNPVVLAALFNLTRTLQTLLLREGFGDAEQTLQSALYWASSRGHHGAVETLLQHRVRLIDPDYGKTALAVAIQGGFTETCTTLLRLGGANPNFSSRESQPPLLLAASHNHREILQQLLQHKEIQVQQADAAAHTALMEACRSGSLECLQELLKDGRSDINAKDTEERNALIHASISGKDLIVKLLLRSPQLHLHLRDRYGKNAISYGAEYGHLMVAKRLFHAGISISARDSTGRNAISWAANSTKATRTDGTGKCLLEYLVEKCPDGVDVKDVSGWSPLAWALDRPGHLRSVQILLEKGHADINQKDQTSGRSILAWAASEGFTEIVRYLLQVPTIDKNGQDYGGRTPLSYAAGHGMLETVELLLLEKEVVADQCDSGERSPLDWAELNHHSEVVEVLRGRRWGVIT